MEAAITENVTMLLDYMSERGETLSPLLIMVHDYPDPDAIASSVALQYLAESEFGIRSRIVYGGTIGRMENRTMVRRLKLPLHKLRTTDIKRHARVALVDTQPKFGNNSFPSRMKAAIVIDQHGSDEEPDADLVIVDNTCGATCVLLAQALLEIGKPIPTNIATAIAYGIITDTQSFLRSSRHDVIDVYLNILPFADLGVLAEIQNPPQPRRFFTNLVRGIQHAAQVETLLFSHLGSVEYPDVVAEIADLILSMRGIRWSMCTGRYKGTLRISLRSSGARISASEVLRDIVEFRGEAGGHDSIAGGSIRIGMEANEETWKDAEEALSRKLIRRLRIPAAKAWKYPFR